MRETAPLFDEWLMWTDVNIVWTLCGLTVDLPISVLAVEFLQPTSGENLTDVILQAFTWAYPMKKIIN